MSKNGLYPQLLPWEQIGKNGGLSIKCWATLFSDKPTLVFICSFRFLTNKTDGKLGKFTLGKWSTFTLLRWFCFWSMEQWPFQEPSYWRYLPKKRPINMAYNSISPDFFWPKIWYSPVPPSIGGPPAAIGWSCEDRRPSTCEKPRARESNFGWKHQEILAIVCVCICIRISIWIWICTLW